MLEKRHGGFPSHCCQQAVDLEFTGADRQAVQSPLIAVNKLSSLNQERLKTKCPMKCMAHLTGQKNTQAGRDVRDPAIQIYSLTVVM